MREMLAKCEDCDRPKDEEVNGNTAAEERERSSGVLKKRVRSGENCGKERGLGIARLSG